MRTALTLLILSFTAPLSACAPVRATRPWAEPPEIVAEFDTQVTGVAVSHSGRLFVNSPYWRDPHGPSVFEVMPDGALVPFPDERWNEGPLSDLPPGERFVCVQSVTVDSRDFLWVLDPGSPMLAGVVPGAPKVLRIDLRTNRVVYTHHFDPTIALPDSYLNDIRVDVNRGVAYITDSGRPGIVVLDFRRNTARRVLDMHPTTSADPAVTLTGDTRPLMLGSEPLRVHADGLALTRNGRTLYWQALTGRTLYAIDTALLRDASNSDESIAAAVRTIATTSATDGMEIDRDGNLYLSDFENDAVRVFNTRFDESARILVRSDLLVWPDSFAWGPSGDLYVTTAQIHRTDWFTGAMPTEPYRVLRFRLHHREDPLWDVRKPMR